MRDSFVFYKSFYESIKELELTDQVKIYNAIFEYEFYNNQVELNGISKSIFTLVLPQLEANNKRYENGKKGGRPKNQTETKTKPKQNQTKTKVEPNVNVNVNVNDNIKKNIKKKVYFENEKVNDIFLEYLDLRKKIKLANTDTAIKLLLNKLNKFDDNTKIKMIEASIEHSWKSVYELKDGGVKNTEERELKQLGKNGFQL